MSSIQDEMNKLSKEAAALLREQEQLKKLVEAYPDLQKYVGRWNKVAYYSKSVNGKVTEADVRHNCGCCRDSPLEVWPFLKTEHGNIYSDPPCFTVGEQHWIAGDKPYPGWKQKMRDAGINEAIIELVQRRFDRDREMRKELAEDEEGDE